MMVAKGVVRFLLAGVLAGMTAGCAPIGRPGQTGPAAVRPSIALRVALHLRSPLRMQAVAADIHHLTFTLVNASDGVSEAGTVQALPPLASPLTLTMPAPPDGSYRLTVEAFGGEDPTSSLSVGGALLSANTVTVSGQDLTYSTGTAFTFPSSVYLKAGGTVAATVTGTGDDRIDVAVLQGGVVQSEMQLSPATFPVQPLPPGTYELQVKRYNAAGTAVIDIRTSDPVTVGGPETGYAVSGPFTVAF